MTYREYKFNQKEADHELKSLNENARLSQPFALRMATIISFAVISSISILGVFFGDKTPLTLGLLATFVLIFGIISFGVTRSACL